MANSINGMFDANALQAVHWRKWLEQLGLSVRLYSDRLGQLAQRVEAALPDTQAEAAAWNVPDAPLDKIAALVQSRSKVLQAVRQ